jgi:GNAT superfamily N-acetyltransferase
MIQYREATFNDWERIARLHTRSWQRHYRGILRDEFLDNELLADRLATWKERFQFPKDNQHVILAEEGDTLWGFACVFADHDPVWGSLLDNLHVLSESQGRGVGANLLKKAAQWSYTRNPDSGFYLWVYETNTLARKFYDKMGGINRETIRTENPGGGSANICRYVWTDLPTLFRE